MTTAKIGDVYAMPVPGGTWGALQVLAEAGRGQLEVATLRGLWDAPPTARAIARCKVQREDWGSWQGRPDRAIVDCRVPPDARFVANIAVVESFTEPCNTYGGGWSATASFWSWRWNVALGKRDRARYRAGGDTSEIAIDLGAGPTLVRADKWKLRLGGASGEIAVPAANIAWSALAALGLTEIDYTGADPGFVDFVRGHRLLNTVRWREHGHRRIDLRDTLVTDLVVDAARAPVHVIAPRYLGQLMLAGALDRISIDLVDAGPAFRATFEGAQLPRRVVAGLERITSLAAWRLASADLRRLVPYAQLVTLELRGAPGSITHLEALAKLTRLSQLSTYELWDLDGDTFPPHPALEHVEIVGLRKRAVATLKRKLANVAHVRLANAKTDEWIAANLEHPLRDWGDDDARMGRTAIAAWNKAAAAATRAGTAAPARTAEAILKAFVAALNALDHKYGIDTIRREQACEAFAAIAERFANVPAKTAEQWFDSWRDF